MDCNSTVNTLILEQIKAPWIVMWKYTYPWTNQSALDGYWWKQIKFNFKFQQNVFLIWKEPIVVKDQ